VGPDGNETVTVSEDPNPLLLAYLHGVLVGFDEHVKEVPTDAVKSLGLPEALVPLKMLNIAAWAAASAAS